MNYTWNPEGERIAEQLIKNYHPHLRGFEIAYMFKAKPPEVAVEEHTPADAPRRPTRRKSSTGKIKIAECRLVSQKYRLLFAKDYRWIITADQEIWDAFDDKQKTAVIDHELCHAVLDDDGNPRIRKHDLEEFSSIAQRYGYYLPDVQRFAEAIKRGERQEATHVS